MRMAVDSPADALAPNLRFAQPADAATLERTAEALRGKGYDVQIADDRETARRMVLELVPEGTEVSEGASRTLDELGVTAEIEQSGRYDAVRPRTRAMDRTTPEGLQAMRKLSASPDYWLNSAHAVIEDGRLVIVSNTGSQLGPIAFGAGTVIFAIGSQKIVPDLDTAFQRIDEYTFRLEDARLRGLYGVGTSLNKILIVNKEFRPGRFHIVLIRDAVGW
jgi:LUD domain